MQFLQTGKNRGLNDKNLADTVVLFCLTAAFLNRSFHRFVETHKRSDFWRYFETAVNGGFVTKVSLWSALKFHDRLPYEGSVQRIL